MAANARPPVDMFTPLPPELQSRIFDLLSYQESIRVSQLSRYFHQLVQPQQWPTAEKAHFVRAAQCWPKHNVLVTNKYTYHSYHRNGAAIQHMTNGYACYSCYRVRPRGFFSTTQTSGCKSKKDPTEGLDQWNQRHCIDCAITAGLYKPGTRVNVCNFSEYRSDIHGRFRYMHGGSIRFFCGQCNVLTFAAPTTYAVAERELTCGGCHKRYRKWQLGDTYGHDGLLFSTCKQCHNDSPHNWRAGDSCRFCRADICIYCSIPCTNDGGWWCGKDCSKDGYAFCMRMRVSQWPMKTPRLGKIIDEKRGRRPYPEETDLLEMEVDLENILEWLKL